MTRRRPRSRLDAVRLESLDYQYAPEAVAQRPLADRDGARLLHLPSSGSVRHLGVRDLRATASGAYW